MIDFSRFNSIFELTEYFNTEDKCRRAIFESRLLFCFVDK